ncbi:MAG: hypothetical protein LRY49_05510 [Burkholderiaceae bacterium]|nr:hypothetical protein [Burkholderiaceae bacterium]
MKLKLASCLLALLPAATLGQEVPKEMAGIWATPNCSSPQDTLAFYKSFYLWIGEQETALTGLTKPQAQPQGWTRLEDSDGYPNFFTVLPDGRLREAFLPDNADSGSTPADDWQTTDYESCGNTLPRSQVLLHGEPVALLQVLSNAQSICQTNRQACASELFAGIDVSGDGNLSTAEIARLFRVAGYLATVSEDTPASNDELVGVVAAALPVGPLIASAIINSFDYDDNGVVSLAELSQDRGTLIDQLEPETGDELNSRLNQMKEALKPLGRLLENFGQ